MNNLSCKIYITDEGFGPIVRQSVIIEELRKLSPAIDFTMQLSTHVNEAQKNIIGVPVIKKFNNIVWHKTEAGEPDISSIKEFYSNYQDRSEKYIREELAEKKYSFFISDFVYEAFEIAQQKNIPAFGVAHFTWDWFFSKLYPPPLKRSLIDAFFESANKAECIYFPPLTPNEILSFYKSKAVKVPFIVRKSVTRKITQTHKFKVLIIDSGAQVLKQTISKAIKKLTQLKDFDFFISDNFDFDAENFHKIPASELMIDYIPNMDLVIGRAGFNTISECIAFRIPMLLLGEAMNPEMQENIVNIKKEGLGSFISLQQFTDDLSALLPRFVNGEYKTIKENMQNHTFETNGAEIIAKDILNRMKK